MPDPADAVRAFNRSRVLRAVGGGAHSRADLIVSTGLARSTVTGLVRELVAEGRLAEGAPSAARDPGRAPGRPARRLDLAPRRDVVVAVDFGHSHCRVAVIAVHMQADGARVDILAQESRTLDVDASPTAALGCAEEMARTLLAAVPDERPVVGAIGVPAPVDPLTGAVGTGNLLPRWVDLRPADELSHRLRLRFGIDNDANLGALAATTVGVARGATDLIYVKVATGVGAGLLLGGRLHRGADGRAGEIGHVPVDPHGLLCRCGNRGCLETLVSVPRVLAAFEPRAGRPVTLEDLARLVREGDPGAVRLVGDAGRLIGRALADLVNVLNPRHVVVGGRLAAAAGAPLLAGVRESVGRDVQPGLATGLTVSVSGLEESAELVGAAALAASLGPTRV